MIRRAFLRSAGAAAIGAGLLGVPGAAQAHSPVWTLRRDRSAPGVRVPDGFVGLGYEMSSAARLGLLSPENTRYVELLRNLGRSGVLRFGGIVADFTSYEPGGTVVAEPKRTVVTRASLRQLRAFLDRVGWRAIWSVNFGSGTLERAVAEARDVASILGDRLLALELGNEVENYGRGAAPLRTPPYTFATYREEYARWHDAILAAVPRLTFAAPDTADSVQWVEKMAADARDSVQLLTTHYYRGGQQQGTPEQLAVPDPALGDKLRRLGAASRQSGIPWRMCETNSFFGGGRPGVSDTLLGALWTLDFMLLLAQSGCSGVNLETGVNQLGFISSYSPIQDDGQGRNRAGAPYYGMLACALAIRSAPEMMPLVVQGGEGTGQPARVTAYALGEAGQIRSLVVVNRSATEPALLAYGELGLAGTRVVRLTGEGGLSSKGILLGGAAVREDGIWSGRGGEATHGATLRLGPMSAAVLLPAGELFRVRG